MTSRTPTQKKILTFLKSNSFTYVADANDYLDVSVSTYKKAIKALESEGLLSKYTEEDPGTAQRFGLTAAGLEEATSQDKV